MFTFAVSPEDLFRERAIQMQGWGIPAQAVARVRGRVREMWTDGPGGWTYEWSLEAENFALQKRWLLAALCYGAARFPCAATASRRAAQQKQIECYLCASKKFPGFFERRILNVEGKGKALQVPVHLFSRTQNFEKPILLFLGGVDTFKVELHRLALVLALAGDFCVASLDMPGTGESPFLLEPDSERILFSVIEALQNQLVEPQKVGVLGISFGAHWAAKLALLGKVNAAVNIGGPVGHLPLDAKFLSGLPNGMPGIIANAIGLDELPTEAKADELLAKFSLRQQGLFDSKNGTPLLVINGSLDPYIPEEETTVFRSVAHATVWQIDGATHCAAEKFSHFLPAMIVWLREQLYGPTLATRMLSGVSRRFFSVNS